MVDEKLVALAMMTKGKLAKMKDARPSEIMAVKERFADQFLEVLKGMNVSDIPVEHKIAFFDIMAKGHVDGLITEVENRLSGEYCEDDDSDTAHYAWEAERQAVFGSRIFDATNELEGLLRK